jgi:hypothetical protein
VVTRDAVRAICTRGFPTKDRFSIRDTRLAWRVLSTVARYRRDMDGHAVYRRIMDELQEDIVSCPTCEEISDLPRFQTGIAAMERMTLAALAIVEGERGPERC